MLKNFLKIAWRTALKQRQSTILNLIGLSTGLTCTLLIYLWVSNELEVDKFNANDSRLYIVMKNTPNSDGTIFTSPFTQGLLAKSMTEDLPEIEYAVPARSAGEPGIMTTGDKHLKAKAEFAGKDFFTVFSYRLLDGNRSTALSGNEGVLLSDKLAMSLFNTTQGVIGKTITWNHGDEFDGLYRVSGVFQSPPSNATEQFDVLFPFSLYAAKKAGTMGDISYWGSNNTNTYIVLKKGVDATQFGIKIKDYTKAKIKVLYTNDDVLKYEGDLFLQRYSDRYLYNNFVDGKQSGGRIEYVKLFSAIAIFIMLIACINFMNLSTAQATKRMKEVGIRKVIGAKKSTLVFQYISQSILLAFTSLGIALLLVVMLLPSFELITGKQLALHFSVSFICGILIITLLTGLIAGSYPALYLSGFKPVLVLKGRLNTSAGEAWVRKGLVVFQFVISVFLIIAVLVIKSQMNLVQTKDLGYNKDNIIHFVNDGNIQTRLTTFINDAKKIPGVINASSMDGNMTGLYSQGGGGIAWPGKGPNDGVEFTGLDMDYGMIEMLGLKITEGRGFSPQFGSDSNSVIFNQSAIAAMHLKAPIGKIATLWGKPMRIVGVVNDFQFGSMYKKTGPFFLRCTPANNNVFIKIKAGTERETLARLEKFYQQYNPGLPFEYKFLDDDYAALYASEQRVSVLSKYFAALAVIISCLGLFGLVSFTAQKRQKEIGIRKVIGASVPNVVLLLSADFMKLVLVAMLVAFPLAWWVMHNWLQNFAYRVTISAGVFIITTASILVITVLTISLQAIKAAVANPVNALRSE